MTLKISQLSRPVLPHYPSSSSSSSQTLSSASFSSFSFKQPCHVSNGRRGPLVCRFDHKLNPSSLFRKSLLMTRTTCCASDEEISGNIEDSDDHNSDNSAQDFEQDSPDDENIPADIERKLFWQVFLDAPSLMLQLMILLVNFTAYSMNLDASGTENSPATEIQNQKNQKSDSSFSDSASEFLSSLLTREEAKLWKSMVEEARKMEGGFRDGEVWMKRPVLGFSAKIESDEDYQEYLKTELCYLSGLSRDPTNPLLLANYGQFLCLVAHDYDRAEEYFQRAIGVKEEEGRVDAEAYNKYANFLWKIRKDLSGAQQNYLAAISAEPSNSHYAASYVHFLWSTSTTLITH